MEERILELINQKVSQGGRRIRYLINEDGITAITCNMENNTEFVMCKFERNGNADNYLYEQVLNYIEAQQNVTYIINWSKACEIKQIYKSVFCGNNLQEIIDKFMTNKNSHDYIIWNIELINHKDAETITSDEIIEVHPSSNAIRVTELESEMIMLVTKTSNNHTVHFNYSVDDNRDAHLKIYTYNVKTKVKFVLFSTTSMEPNFVSAQCEMLSSAILFMKNTIDPQTWITYKVEWKICGSDIMNTSIFNDYTIQKLVNKIFVGNSNIIVITMRFVPVFIS